MKYRFKGTKKANIGALGIVEPGQEFEVENEYMIETISIVRYLKWLKKKLKK